MIMFTQFSGFLRAPVFEDEEKTRIAGLLNTILLALLMIAIVYLGVGPIIDPRPLPGLIGNGLTVVVYLISLWLMRRGWVGPASLLFAFAFWVMVTAVAIAYGGVETPALFSYFSCLVVSGLLLGGRGVLGFAGLSILSGLGLLFGEANGLLPAPILVTTPVIMWWIASVNFVMVAVLLYLAHRGITTVLEGARQNEKALAQANQELRREIIDRKRTEEALKHLAEQRKRLLEASRLMLSTLALDEVGQRMLQALQALLSYDICVLFWLDEEAGVLRPSIAVGKKAPYSRLDRWTIPFGQGISSRVIESGKGELVNNAHHDPQSVYPEEDQIELEHLISIPVRIQAKTVGVFHVSRNTEPPFTEEEFELVQLFIAQAAIAIENAQLYADIEQRAVELSTLLETAKVISSAYELEERLGLIAKQMVRAIGVSGCTLSRWDKETDTIMTWIEWRQKQPEYADNPGATYNLNDFPATRTVLEQGQPLSVLITNPNTNPVEVAYLKQVDTLSMLMLPLAVGKRVIGLVELDDDEQERIFTPAEIHLCQALANQAAVAIENAQLYAETQKRLKEQIVLREASAVISSTLELETVLSHIAEQLGRAIDATSTYIASYEAQTNETTLLAEYFGPEASAMERVSDLGVTYDLLKDFPDSLKSVQTSQPKTLHYDDPNVSEAERNHMKEYGAKSVLDIPLQIGGQTIAIATLWESRQRREFRSDEIALCQSIAQQAAIAIQNARLYEQAQQEITERKRVEDALRESEQTIQTILSSIMDYIWSADIIDGQLVYRYYSPVVEEITGYPPDYFMTGVDAWLNIIHPEDKDQAKRELEKESAGEVVTHEYRVVRPDGEVKWLFGTTSPTLDQTGRVIRLQGVVSDITERKRLEEQLRQAQKMEAIGTLAGGIAHDFNNMLTAIMGYSALAIESLPNDNPARSDIQGIEKIAHRAADLTNQLLAFARRQMIEPNVLNLNALILNTSKMLRRLIGEDIELVTLPTPDLGQIKVDSNQIEQVLINLVVNARDAMPAGGKLVIETANVTLGPDYIQEYTEVIPGEYVMLAVSDNGVGMTEEVKSHVFEPFFTTKEVGQGTGLGLATSFGIIKQSGGHIEVHSKPGQGTTVEVYLPRAIEANTLVTKPKIAYDLPHGTETILLVEDDPSIRYLTVRTLHHQGYTVLEAANGSEALDLLREQTNNEIDLLITDVVMPKMGGKALADHLRSLQPDIKVLYVSGYTDETLVPEDIIVAGVNFLQKPFSPNLLAQKVYEVLNS